MLTEIAIKPFGFKCASSVLPPGSKSLTNRAMILAALAGGRTRIEGALFSRDTEIMADCLARLGYVVNLNRFEKSIEIESPGGQPPNSCAQETDRVAACAAQLRKFCAKVEETEDSISITPHPPERLAEIAQTPTLVNTYADHRIAMSFSILASRDVRGEGRPWIIIEDPGCVSKTWAEFFEVLYTARSDSGALRVVAVDGGAAVGKSSVSKECARILGYMHVDTGAHYRTVAYALLGEGISSDDPAVVAERLKSVKLGTALCGNSARATLDGKLVDDALIRTERVNSEVAKFAAIAEVREFLKSYQRSMADFARSRGFAGLIMEGRDIGSVIFPDADVRIFLDADEQTRAARRAREGIADSIGLRDAMDRSRKTAPLRCPESAERIDTSNMTKDEVVRLTLSLILES